MLRSGELQLSRGESPRDTALVLSRMAAAVGVRTHDDAVLEELAAHATIPVINMLTAGHHPCQALADLLTLREAFGRLDGLVLAYVGDGSNVARSLALLGPRAGVEARVAAPDGYQLEPIDGLVRTDDPAAARRAPTRSTRTSGSRWGMRRRRTPGGRPSARTAWTTPCWIAPRPARSRCTACRPTLARRSPPRRSTAPAAAHLGPGREPPPRPEGPARAPGPRRGGRVIVGAGADSGSLAPTERGEP